MSSPYRLAVCSARSQSAHGLCQLVSRPVLARLADAKTGKQAVQVGGGQDDPRAVGFLAEVKGAAEGLGRGGVASAAHRVELQLRAGCREADQVGDAPGDVRRSLGRQISCSLLLHQQQPSVSFLLKQQPSCQACGDRTYFPSRTEEAQKCSENCYNRGMWDCSAQGPALEITPKPARASPQQQAYVYHCSKSLLLFNGFVTEEVQDCEKKGDKLIPGWCAQSRAPPTGQGVPARSCQAAARPAASSPPAAARPRGPSRAAQ